MQVRIFMSVLVLVRLCARRPSSRVGNEISSDIPIPIAAAAASTRQKQISHDAALTQSQPATRRPRDR